MKFLLILTAFGPCEQCLNGTGFQTNFWCVSHVNEDKTVGACLPLSEINSCGNHESHDLVLNATMCCSPIQTENVCLSAASVSFCLWCPQYTVDDKVMPGQCLYNDDTININTNCPTNPDITSFCSQYKDCASCATDVVCAWCPEMGRCVTAILADMPFPDEQYKCTNGMTKVCCESYKDCATCSTYSGTVNSQICTWCQKDLAGDGACMTHDNALKGFANKECLAINELGVEYCEDNCYMKGQTCSQCIGTAGCIWLENISYTTSGTNPEITQFCTAGGMGGPAETTIEYETTMTMPYAFKVLSYNYMTCGMSANALNILFITLGCVIVGGAIITYVTMFIYKKVKYQKLLREAAKREVTEDDKKMLQQKQEEFDIEDFMITIQAIPWTD